MEYLLRNGKRVTIRKPNINDAEAIINIIKKADTETFFWQGIRENFALLLTEKNK